MVWRREKKHKGRRLFRKSAEMHIHGRSPRSRPKKSRWKIVNKNLKELGIDDERAIEIYGEMPLVLIKPPHRKGIH